MRTVVTYLMIVILLSLLVACGGEPAAEVAETEAPTEEAAPATEAPTDTPEPEPTDTPEPEPTDTPEPTPTPTEDVAALVEEALADAEASLEAEEYEAAVESYTAVLELDDEHVAAYLGRADAYEELDLYEESLADYEAALDLDAENPQIYTDRAIIYRVQDEYEAAMADVEQALELDDAFAEAYYQRGRIYAAQDEDEAALAEYDRAIELDGEQAGYYNSRGLAREGLDDDDGALEDYNTSIDIDPDYKWPYKNRADIYRLRDEYDEALTNYTAAIDLDPDYDTAYYNRGRTYAEMEDYEAALADFSAAIEIDPEYANAYKRRADVYAALEDEEQAIADWQMYFDVAEDLEDKVEAADELAAYDIAVEFPPIEVELETFEHPSGAFSVSVPVEAANSSVDEADMGTTLNTLAAYNSVPGESPLRPFFVVVAGVDAKAADESLDDFDSQGIIRLMFGSDSNVAETLNEERLDDNRLLLELAVDDSNSPLNRAEVLVEDSGDSRFVLFFTTNNFSVFESAWTEISESYTFDPDGAAEALAAAGAEAEAAAAAAAEEEQAAESSGATGQAVPLQQINHPSGTFSVKVPADFEATLDDPESLAGAPHSISSGYFGAEGIFFLIAGVGPAETLFEGQSLEELAANPDALLSPGQTDGVGLINQSELADGSLLLEMGQPERQEGSDGTFRMHMILAQKEGMGFMLLFFTPNFEAFEPTWTEILNSYSFTP